MATSSDKSLAIKPVPRPRLRTVLFIGLLTAFALTLTVLGNRMIGEISALQSAPNDNIQWNLAQLEIEYLQLLNSLQAARATTEKTASDIPEVRKRFDILYSRIETFRRGQAFHILEGNAEANKRLAVISTSLAEAVPVIDGADAALYDSLADLEDHFLEIRSDIRSLALQSVRIFAQSSDRQREDFTLLLRQTAIAGALLILALVTAVTVLIRQFRVAENRAREASTSNSRFQSTVNASLDGIILAGADGRIIDFNPPAEAIFGYTRNRAIGSKMEDLIIPEHLREAHRAGMRRFLDSGVKKVIDAGRVELDGMRASGETFPIELSIGMTTQADGPIFIAYIRDISDRKRNHRELKAARDDALAADKAKSQFLAMMSHEMRTPLNGVLATLDLLQNSKLTASQTEYVGVATASGEILQQHLDDVLDLTQIEAGAMEFRYEYFALTDLLQEVRKLNSMDAAKQGDEIRIELDPDLTMIHSDRHRLRQILLNLVGNAVKFTENGTITVTAKSVPGSDHANMIELKVSDTGIGMKTEDIQHIFQDFVTLDSSYRRKTQGYGLGLAICRRITEALGGRINVESTPGQGSVFTVIIPDSATQQESSEHESGPTSASTGEALRVLLVEDNETNRFVATRMLEAEGCRVAVAHNGMEGVEKAAEGTFDLILMDISMPQMDGIEATRLIREGNGRSAATPIIGLTAHALPHELENLAKAGMQDCLIKPLRRRNLQDILGSFNSPQASSQNTGIEAGTLQDGPLQELEALLAPDRLKLRLQAFIDEIDETMSGLKADLEAGRMDELSARAHRCTGSAATFGATNLADAMRRVQEAAEDGRMENLRAILADLDGVSGRTRKALRDFLHRREQAPD